MIKYLKPLADLLYPELCVGCEKYEPVHEKLFCHYCWKEIPRYSDLDNNSQILEQKFPLIFHEKLSLYGLFLFSKKGIVQGILHNIKYRGKRHVAEKLGQHLSSKIPLKKYDALIPVPMHYRKLRRRGYNQAFEIAKGINKNSNKPILTNILEKAIDTDSQTKNDRATRHASVLKSYSRRKKLPKNINNILLVDDVITTGATLEACTTLLQAENNVNIDYAFLAMSI